MQRESKLFAESPRSPGGLCEGTACPEVQGAAALLTAGGASWAMLPSHRPSPLVSLRSPGSGCRLLGVPEEQMLALPLRLCEPGTGHTKWLAGKWFYNSWCILILIISFYFFFCDSHVFRRQEIQWIILFMDTSHASSAHNKSETETGLCSWSLWEPLWAMKEAHCVPSPGLLCAPSSSLGFCA